MRRVCNFGGRPQRLLWASTGTKDPSASATLYVEALAAPMTVNTMPEQTLKAVAALGDVRALLDVDVGDAAAVLAHFARAGIDAGALAARLQEEGAAAFVKSWNAMLKGLHAKRSALAMTA